MELWNSRETEDYAVQVHMLPQKLDEEVSRLHLEQLGVQLILTEERADYSVFLWKARTGQALPLLGLVRSPVSVVINACSCIQPGSL